MAALSGYPYTDGAAGETTEECTLKGKPIAIEAGSGYKVTWYAEKMQRLKYALSLGPVAISMKANCLQFIMYWRGVLTSDGDCSCGPDDE